MAPKSKEKLRPTSIHRIGLKAIDISLHQGSFHPSTGRERNGREETNATASGEKEKKSNSQVGK